MTDLDSRVARMERSAVTYGFLLFIFLVLLYPVCVVAIKIAGLEMRVTALESATMEAVK